MRKLLIFIFIIIGQFLYADTVGENAYDFLNISVDPGAMGLGNTYMFGSFYTNPTNAIKDTIVITAHDYKGVFDTNIGGFGGTYSVSNHVFGIHMNYFNYGSFQRTDSLGNLIGEFSSYDILFSFFYKLLLKKYGSLGIRTDFIYSVLDTTQSTGITVDLIYKGSVNNILWDGGIINIGKVISGYGSNVNKSIMPTLFAGIGYNVTDFNFYILSEFYYSLNRAKFLRFGILKPVSKYLTLKAGFDGYIDDLRRNSGDLSTGITFGAKIDYNNFQLDAGYLNSGVLGKVFSLGLSYRLNLNIADVKEKENNTVEEISSFQEDTFPVEEDTLVNDAGMENQQENNSESVNTDSIKESSKNENPEIEIEGENKQ